METLRADPEGSKWIVYCHTHIESDRHYIGVTKRDIETRWFEHICDARSGRRNSHFHGAIIKYGIDAFKSKQLETCISLEAANRAEEFWIGFFDSTNPKKGFNISKGGRYNSSYPRPKGVKVIPPEVRAKISATQMGKKRRIDYSKISRILKGRPLTPEHRANISKAQIGKIIPLEVRARMSLAQKGKPRNPESIRKSANSRKGIIFTPEHRANLGKAHKGKKHTQEHIDKVAAALRARPKPIICHKGHSLEDAYLVGKRKMCRKCQSIRSAKYYAKKTGKIK